MDRKICRFALLAAVSCLFMASASCAQNAASVEEESWEGAKAGDRGVLTIEGIECAFRFCPSGSFMMGSPEDEQGRWAPEKQRRVTLTQPFWMAETETSQKLYQAVMGTDPSDFLDDDLPVEQTGQGWCVAFTDRLNELNIAPKGWKFALPTEAQWEYAARAGSETAYPWGDALNGDKANCNGHYPCGTTEKGTYLMTPAPVYSYEPNAWGLYCMCGNVYEWVKDEYQVECEETVDPCVVNGSCVYVMKGGCWSDFARYCRCAARYPLHRDCHHYLPTGFRFALVRDSK